MEMNYYEAIVDYLEKNPLGKIYENTPKAFSKLCQEYYWYHTMYNKLRDSIRVLQNYIDEENYVAKRKMKNESGRKNKIDMEDKLYAEYFSQIYDKYYKDTYKWTDTINDIKKIKKLLGDFLLGDEKTYIELMERAVFRVYKNRFARLNIDKLHHAMEVVGKVLKTPKPGVKESVENVISEDWLETMYSWLKEGKAIYFLFTIAPINRALYDGTYHKYMPGTKKSFFRLKCEYNLVQLRNYIQELRELHERYTYTMEELSVLSKKHE